MIIILGDTHFGIRENIPFMYEYQKKFYDYLFDFIDLHNVKTIIQTGDLFDKRKSVNFLSLQKANEMFFDQLDARNIELYVVCGNHDSFYRSTNRVNAPKLLQRRFMTVVDTYPHTINKNGLYVDLYPWINEENEPASLKFANESESNVAIGHFEFANFPLHPGTIAEHGLDHSKLSKYKTVFSGHYHTRSQKDNVIYVGTPYEMDWSDYNDPKGFTILKDDGSYQFNRNPFTLHHKFSYDENEVPDIELEYPHHIKVTVVNKTDQKKFDKFIERVQQTQPLSLQIIDTEMQKSVETALNTKIEFKGTHHMLMHVIDDIAVNDKDVLKKKMSEIYTEAMELSKL
jgi:DNA repair exonuclease SbcCD nuclease subunit